MTQYSVGEFEEIVLLTVAILDGKAYALSIIEEMAERLDRKASIGAIQTVLKRLEDKRMVLSHFGEATNIRGGKRKRLYKITSEGKRILEITKTQRMALWNAIPNLSLT